MARSRRRPLTRDDLLHRYATINGLTYAEAHERHAETDLENLRAVVEAQEVNRRLPYVAQRAAFYRSQRTTTVEGITR